MAQLGAIPDLVVSSIRVAQDVVPGRRFELLAQKLYCVFVTLRFVADAGAFIQASAEKHDRLSAQASFYANGGAERNDRIASLQQAVRVNRVFRLHEMHRRAGRGLDG